MVRLAAIAAQPKRVTSQSRHIAVAGFVRFVESDGVRHIVQANPTPMPKRGR